MPIVVSFNPIELSTEEVAMVLYILLEAGGLG